MTPTFDQGNDSILFALGVMALWLASVGDVLVTRMGIWYHSMAEGNPIYKILPAAVRKFIFNGAAGSFVDGAFRLVIAISLLEASKAIGFANNGHSYLPFGLAFATTGLVVRNFLLIRKKPVSATIGQVS